MGDETVKNEKNEEKTFDLKVITNNRIRTRRRIFGNLNCFSSKNGSKKLRNGKVIETTIENADLLSNTEKDQKVVEKESERAQWSNYVEYMLSVIGFVIDLGNVWRFPTVCYRNGGGAFLIPYLTCLFLIGMPCMYLELAMGQYFQSGNISIWNKLAPWMKGVGYSVIIINVFMLSYYMTIQAYALYYFFYSFRFVPSWSRCNNDWNTINCLDIISVLSKNRSDMTSNFTYLNQNITTNHFDSSFAATNEFFNRKLLGSHRSSGFDDLGGLKWDLVFCVFIIFLITSVCLIFGIKSSGKAVYVTAILPYVCLIVLLIQSFTLDGSLSGVLYYLTPKFDRLLDLRVWLDAAVQIFFSLGPGFGVLIAYSSYSPRSTNIQKLTILCAITNCVTSFLYGIVVFSGIGYLAAKLQTDITDFIQEGSGLIYIIYPEIIATFKGASIFAITFFLMLISLGIDSAFGGMEGLYTAITDEFPSLKRHKYICRILIILIPFLTCLPTVSYGGMYVVQWLDTFSVSPSVLVVVLAELLCVSWVYGIKKFSLNIKEMNSKEPYLYWRISWKFICPLCLTIIIIFTTIFFENLKVGTYAYPVWSSVLGWSLNAIGLSPIFIYPICKVMKKIYSKSKSEPSIGNSV